MCNAIIKDFRSKMNSLFSFISILLKVFLYLRSQKYFFLMMMYSSQSQEEGFFPEIPIIEERPISQSNKEQQRPKDYKPYQLTHHNHFKKFPAPMLESFTSIPLIETPEEYLNLLQKYPPFKISDNECSPYQKYVSHPQKYHLIYTKTKNKNQLNLEQTLTERFFFLPNLLHYEESEYSPLKEIDFEDMKENSERTSLQFDSHFQSGNLSCVFQSTTEEHLYHCFTENDTNSYGYNQWFYFSLKGTKKNTLYRFVIPNMRKKYSFFNKGMKPILFSLKKLKRSGSGWFRRGYNIRFEKSDIFFMKDNQKHSYYSLYFELDFDDDDDFVTISYGIPYTYSRLIYQLNKCKEEAFHKEIFFEMKTIDYTLSNNQVPEIIITDRLEDEQKKSKIKKYRLQEEWKGSPYSRKKIIAVFARQHPCQVNSSFLVEELLYSLSRKINYKITWLLENFEFRIFPMINVDGVIYGNTRTDLAGFDLNRVWKNPLKELFPQIYSIKKEIINLHKFNRVAYCLDLHSHSKNFNVFSYGYKEEGFSCFLFSHLLSKLCNHFDFSLSVFKLHSAQQKTARAVLASKIGLTKVSTIEVSYFGSKTEKEVTIFQPRTFQQLSKGVLNTLKSYLRNDRLKKESQKQIETSLPSFQKQNGQVIILNSDSDPEGDNLPLEKKIQMLVTSQLTRKRITQKINQFSDSEGEQLKQKDSIKIERKSKINRKIINSIKTERFQTEIQNRNVVSLREKQSHSVEPMKRIDTKKMLEKVESQKSDLYQESNLSGWKRQLAKLKKTKTKFQRQGLQINHKEHEEEHKHEVQRLQRFDDELFQKEMKRLYKNLKSDRRDLFLQNFRIKRDNQFLIKNSMNSSKIHHRHSLNHEKPFQIKVKVPSLKSLLLSEQHGTCIPITIKSKQHRYESEQRLQNTVILQRNFQQQLKRLKLQYSQRCDANLSIFSKLLKNQERCYLKK